MAAPFSMAVKHSLTTLSAAFTSDREIPTQNAKRFYAPFEANFAQERFQYEIPFTTETPVTTTILPRTGNEKNEICCVRQSLRSECEIVAFTLEKC